MTGDNCLSLLRTIDLIPTLKVGGIRGMIFGDSPLANYVGGDDQNDISSNDNVEDDESEGDMSMITVSGILVKGEVSPLESMLLDVQDIDEISAALDEAVNDPSVTSICLCFASPGGEVTGIPELARKIKKIDETMKPVYGWTEIQACSGAQWLLSQCRVTGMTPTATIGSIGVYQLVLDMSAKYKNEGVNIQAISSGEYKLIGSDFRPLTKNEEDIITNQVEGIHEEFKHTVTNGRPNVKEEALEGLSYNGKEALKLGLTDYVGDSFEDFLNEITK